MKLNPAMKIPPGCGRWAKTIDGSVFFATGPLAGGWLRVDVIPVQERRAWLARVAMEWDERVRVAVSTADHTEARDQFIIWREAAKARKP